LPVSYFWGRRELLQGNNDRTIESFPLIQVFNNLKDAVIVLNNEHTVIYLNQAAAILYETSIELAVGTKFSNIIPDGVNPSLANAGFLSGKNAFFRPIIDVHRRSNGEEVGLNHLVPC
jgi:nitrogen-specific signal transduction histidine kinase